jgi:hypothetical protein
LEEKLLMKSVKFRKSLAILLVAALSLSIIVLFTGCSPDLVPSERPAELVSTWNRDGEPLFVLRADGTGTAEMEDGVVNIRWGAKDGVFAWCWTLDDCGNRCPEPSEWTYSISGRNLSLVGKGMNDGETLSLVQAA